MSLTSSLLNDDLLSTPVLWTRTRVSPQSRALVDRVITGIIRADLQPSTQQRPKPYLSAGVWRLTYGEGQLNEGWAVTAHNWSNHHQALICTEAKSKPVISFSTNFRVLSDHVVFLQNVGAWIWYPLLKYDYELWSQKFPVCFSCVLSLKWSRSIQE